MKVLALYSAGGFAREVVRSVRSQLDALHEPDCEIVFIDDSELLQGDKVHGYRVLSMAEFLAIDGEKAASVAFADGELRRQKVEALAAEAVPFFSIRASTAIIGDQAVIGEGSILADYTVITADANIGRHFHCNIYSYVAHDCQIGDFVTFAPRVSLNGRINVEDYAYIGSDATFLPGNSSRPLTIGEGAVVGAGAVVTKDVPPRTVVVGSPARPLRSDK